MLHSILVTNLRGNISRLEGRITYRILTRCGAVLRSCKDGRLIALIMRSRTSRKTWCCCFKVHSGEMVIALELRFLPFVNY